MIRQRKLAQMRGERSSAGYISRYLAWMQNEGEDGPAAAESLMGDIADTFKSDEGLRVLILLEKATLLSSVPDGSDDCALREANAVRNFVLELRRYVTHGGNR